jgi:hypothetical protein
MDSHSPDLHGRHCHGCIAASVGEGSCAYPNGNANNQTNTDLARDPTFNFGTHAQADIHADLVRDPTTFNSDTYDDSDHLHSIANSQSWPMHEPQLPDIVGLGRFELWQLRSNQRHVEP